MLKLNFESFVRQNIFATKSQLNNSNYYKARTNSNALNRFYTLVNRINKDIKLQKKKNS